MFSLLLKDLNFLFLFFFFQIVHSITERSKGTPRQYTADVRIHINAIKYVPNSSLIYRNDPKFLDI